MNLLPLEPPVDVDRDQAAQEAAKELSKSAYRDSGSLIGKALDKVVNWIRDLLDSLTGTSPNGHAGLAVLICLLLLVVGVVLWRAGVLRTSKKSASQAVFDTARPHSAAEYRALAEREAASGDFALAIRSRFRACVAELTERTLLDERPGRTAYEVVADASKAAPALREILQPAAQVFTEVVYGNRPGTPERYAAVVTADNAARVARVAV
ncbi:DUF4129 domain-containing protein [Kribbella sp.]|uniref:DUF4129 domain-containing protein n=1 Tax=Kribbella sp. TaxID=1871183 RepID=UPI002D5E4DAA|nr:DUF4129 domain-containing protein [Kribbella sp.]HZX06492.1 DUF4129 domain-containing protein [Kribbella sp.]